MKKLIVSAMAFMLLLCTGSAQAGFQQDNCYPCDPCCSLDDWYIGGFAGANWTTSTKHHHGCFSGRHKHHTGYVLAVSIGRSFCDEYRVEFEYAYRNNEFKNRIDCDFCAPHKGHVWSNAYLVNGFWNIPWCNSWCLKPFVGAGIGYASQRLDFSHSRSFICTGNNKKNGFAWQLIAGIEYPICDNIAVSFEYRFFKGRLNNIYSQNLGAGFRYSF